ncbi:glycosyl hydrolase [Rhodoferax aquaticus]|uniref:Glycosyl hydrolase n=1 Tax=Rhodoferax aquaticus TaxID=2527691 RepID=A0A515EST1_9BURK|nr:glycosyl hydrolase [Rhodoferax aquaticus]QDL55715.1 glycosyl hydrolase [Rhodoferax aquaticus]
MRCLPFHTQPATPRQSGSTYLRVLLLAALVLLASCSAPERDPGKPSQLRGFVNSPYWSVSTGLQPLDTGDAPTKALKVPAHVGAVTLAFAIGECGKEAWDGEVSRNSILATIDSLREANMGYIVSTGGADGVFFCDSVAGMDAFVQRYSSTHFIGLDFDIEAGQPDEMLAQLARQIALATQRYPYLRISFTLATVADTTATKDSLNIDGQRVMKAIAAAGVKNYYLNLMVMNFGKASPYNCVVVAKRCDMVASALQAARNVSQRYEIPMNRIELTPMLGVNDFAPNVFTLEDAQRLGQAVNSLGMGGLHFWSINRDGPCAAGSTPHSPPCHGLEGVPKFAFSKALNPPVVPLQ